MSVINQAISVKISLLSSSPTGTAVYSELHDVTSNSMGLFNLQVGNPDIVISGNFEGINWRATNYFLKGETDISG